MLWLLGLVVAADQTVETSTTWLPMEYSDLAFRLRAAGPGFEECLGDYDVTGIEVLSVGVLLEDKGFKESSTGVQALATSGPCRLAVAAYGNGTQEWQLKAGSKLLRVSGTQSWTFDDCAPAGWGTGLLACGGGAAVLTPLHVCTATAGSAPPLELVALQAVRLLEDEAWTQCGHEAPVGPLKTGSGRFTLAEPAVAPGALRVLAPALDLRELGDLLDVRVQGLDPALAACRVPADDTTLGIDSLRAEALGNLTSTTTHLPLELCKAQEAVVV